MDTIKVNKKNVRMVAHRGMSGLECENTCAAFVAAGNRSHYGMETDIHVTADGKFAVIHDGSTERVSGINMEVEKSTLEELRSIRLYYDKANGITRSDLVIPELCEYIRICRRYDKYAVLELKGDAFVEKAAEVIEVVKQEGWLEKTIFISFWREDCVAVRRLLPEAKVQYLTDKFNEDVFSFLKEYDLDLDVLDSAVNKEMVDRLHAAGKEVNCWTVDSKERAEELVACGVDYITSNILE